MGSNLFKYMFVINNHFKVVLSNLGTKVLLLGLEKFWNEFGAHASHTQIPSQSFPSSNSGYSKITFYFLHSHTTIFFKPKLHALNNIWCCCRRSTARMRVTVNICATILKSPVPLFNPCFGHTLVPKDLLYHFNTSRTTFSKFEVEHDVNSLICPLRHFNLWKFPTNTKNTL